MAFSMAVCPRPSTAAAGLLRGGCGVRIVTVTQGSARARARAAPGRGRAGLGGVVGGTRPRAVVGRCRASVEQQVEKGARGTTTTQAAGDGGAGAGASSARARAAGGDAEAAAEGGSGGAKLLAFALGAALIVGADVTAFAALTTPAFADSLKHVLDGLVAGGTGAAVVYPIDVVKTRLQMQGCEEFECEPDFEGTSPMGTSYTGPVDCFTTIIREEGVSGLYSGIVPQIMGVAPEKGLKVSVFGAVQPMLAATALGANGNWLLPTMLAGMTAGCCQVVVTNPLEVTKIRLQMQNVEGTKKPVLEILREIGLGGLYRGAPVTASRDIPSVAIFFVAYEAVKRWLREGSATGELGTLQLLAAGFMAGTPSAALVTPVDVVKTRWQAKGAQRLYSSPIDCLKKSVEEEGLGVLTTGWLPRVLRISPQLAVTLTVYEWLNPH